jgi:hypothetical protein
MIQAVSDNKAPAAPERVRVLGLQPEELDILKPRQRPSLIDWMENNYILTGGTSAIEGPWSREYTPYFVPVAEWFSDTTTREIWIYACAQSGNGSTPAPSRAKRRSGPGPTVIYAIVRPGRCCL